MNDMVDESATCSPTTQYDIFGDPQVVPRVGVEYQAEIPSLIPECDGLQLMKKRSLSAAIKKKGSENIVSKIRLHHLEAEIDRSLDEWKRESDFHRMDIRSDTEVVSPGTVWTDTEHASFIVGLYLFWKNLRLVQQFVGSKNMGDILAYYYGQFYGSSDYMKWSQSRKVQSKRSTDREKILAGLKRPELLPPLSSHISEECKSQMIEVSRKYSEGELSLEEYVFALRNMVGVNMLVGAISTAQEKKGPLKANLIHPCQSWSSATSPNEIIKILTSGLRLSKNRSNDLFWEAVWPRLLARGWHSEQPRDTTGGKYSLVFIVPGIEEFSRSLVRGSQYFDSISDVLKKVASEPELLEFEDSLNTQGEHSTDLLDKDHCGYVQSPDSTWNQDSMGFTIVDTSLLSGGARVITREMRCLPLDSLSACMEPVHSSEEDTSDLLKDATETSLNNTLLACPDSNNSITMANQHDGNSATLDGKRSRTLIKFQFSRRLKTHQLNHSSEYQNLTGGGHEESRYLADPEPNLQESCCSEMNKDSEQARTLSSEGHSKCCSEGSSENIPGLTNSTQPPRDAELGQEKSGPTILIDLNSTLPPRDAELGQENAFPNHIDSSSVDKPFLLSETAHQYEVLRTSSAAGPLEERPVAAGRRQSKRSKPSTKALEAIAYGLIGKKQKRKEMEGISRSMPSRRIFAKTTSSNHVDTPENDNSWCTSKEGKECEGKTTCSERHQNLCI